MNKSFWGIFVIMLGIAGILFITLFQTITNTDEHNSQILKEVTEAAMWDAVDDAYYKKHHVVSISREKFVENFVRRFAESANLSTKYKIEFLDVNETPPKVSIRVSSRVSGQVTTTLGKDDMINYGIAHKIDAILETPY